MALRPALLALALTMLPHAASVPVAVAKSSDAKAAAAVQPHCHQYNFKTTCKTASAPGAKQHCVWCPTPQLRAGGANISHCISPAETCSVPPLSQLMASHGIRRGQSHSEVVQRIEATPARAARQTPQHKLYGLFVRPCDDYGTTHDGKPISEFDTRRYNDDGTYELDRTYYVGDPDCTPINSDTYFKLNLHGNVSYHGENKLFPDTYMANMQWVGATVYIDKNSYYADLVDELADCCPNVTWAANTWINVTGGAGGNCPTVPPDASHMCHLVSGSTDYFNYQWKDTTHYITSRDDFDSMSGWANPLDSSYLREKIEESGLIHPEDCDYALWEECKPGITSAETNCESCVGLECDGCLFRELNPSDGPTPWNPSSSTNNWSKCCPCVAMYADKIDKSWLKTFTC